MKLNIIKLFFVILFVFICLPVFGDETILPGLRLEPQLKSGFSVINYSPDRKKLFTASPDGTLQIIDSATGIITRTLFTNQPLPPPFMAPVPACFTVDGSKAAITSVNFKTISIYDMNAGRQIGSIIPAQPVRSISFTFDGKYLLTVLDNSAVLYNSADCAKLWSVSGGYGQFSTVNIPQKSASNEICLIKNISGRVEFNEADNNTKAKYGKENEVVGLSNDGQMIIAISKNPPFKYRVWEKSDDKEYMREGIGYYPISPVINRKFQINARGWTKMNIDALTGKSTNTLTRFFAICASATRITDTDKLAVCETADYFNGLRKLIFVDNADGKSELKETIPLSVSSQISPDGKYIITGSGESAVIIKTDTGEIIKKLSLVNSNAAAFSPDSEEIAIASFNMNAGFSSRNPLFITRINLVNDTAIKLKTGDIAKIRYCAADTDRSYLLLKNNENNTIIWNMKTGKCKKLTKQQIASSLNQITLNSADDLLESNFNNNELLDYVDTKLMINSQNGINSDMLSPDGKYQLKKSGEENAVCLFDISKSNKLFYIDTNAYLSNPAVFSPDSKSLLIPDINQKSLQLIDIASQKPVSSFNIPADFDDIGKFAFSPDGSYIAAVNAKKQLAVIWKSTAPDEYFRISIADHAMSAFTFTADSKQLIITCKNSNIIFCDLAGKNYINRAISLSDDAVGIYHFQSLNIIAIAYQCGLIQLYYENDWKIAGTLFNDIDGNWVTYDPQNHFETADPDIVDSLCGVIEDKTISVKQLRNNYFTPGLLNKIIANKNNQQNNDNKNAILPPKTEVILPDGQNTILHIKLIDCGGGIGAVRVILNGNVMNTKSRDEIIDINGKYVKDTVDLAENGAFLSGEMNTIQVVTSIADNSMQTKSDILYWRAPVLTVEKNVRLMPQSCHVSSITDIQISADGNKALSTDIDGKIIIWDIASGEKLIEFARDMAVNNTFNNAVFSPDGQLIAAVSGDNIYLWDIKSGRIMRKMIIPQIRNPYINYMPVQHTLSFAPNGIFLTLSTESGMINRLIVFDMKNGQAIKDLQNVKVLFDVKNKMYIEANNNGMTYYQLSDIMTPASINETCQIENVNKSFHSVNADFTKIALLANGKLTIADTHTGKEIATLLYPPADGGKSLNTGLNPRKSLVAMNTAGNRCAALNDLREPIVILWDAEKALKLSEYSISGDTGLAPFCKFSPDGNRLVVWVNNWNAICMADADSGKILWNIAGRQDPPQLAGGSITSLQFTNEGKYLLIAYSNGSLEKRDAETGMRERVFGYPMFNFDKIGFSNDDKLVTSYMSSPVNIWSLPAGSAKLLPVISRNNQISYTLSADLSTLMLRQNTSVSFRDVQTNTEKSNLRIFTLIPPKISTDGRIACLTTNDSQYNRNSPNSLTTLLCATDNGQIIKTWKSTEPGKGIPNAFSNDFRYCLNFYKPADKNNNELYIYDTVQNITIPAFTVPEFGYKTLFSNKSGDILLLSQKTKDTNDCELSLWNIREKNWRWKSSMEKISQNNINTFQGNPMPNRNQMYLNSQIYFSSDDKTIFVEKQQECLAALDAISGEILWRSLNAGRIHAISSDSRFIIVSDAGISPIMKVLDTRNGTQTAVLPGSSKIICAAFSRDNRWLAIGYADGAIILWDTKSWRKICVLYTFNDRNWAVIDPLGRYDTSNAGDIDTLRWVINDEIIALHQLKDRYYEPALLAKLLGYNDEPLRPVDDIAEVKLFPSIQIVPPMNGDTKININLVNRGGGIGTVRVLVNGKEFMADARGAKTDPKAKNISSIVDLADSATLQRGRENLIEIISTNADGTLSSRSRAFSFFAPGKSIPRQPELYAIITGTSNYAGNKLNLRYAAHDANAMSNAIAIGAKRLFGVDKVHITQLTTDSSANIKPTKDNLQKAFKKVANQANTDDLLFIYFAGHGAVLPGGNDTYCYLTCDAKDIRDLSDPVLRGKTAVTSDELRQWCNRIPALKQVMILDTCAAGAAAGALIEKREISGEQIRAIERLKDRTGFYILMGCAANARSYETSRYGQGILTYSLLQGMKGGALREGQFIDVNSLFNYAVDNVPSLATGIGGLQRPLIAIPKGNSFDIGQLTSDDRGKIPAAIVKPLLLRPALINIDTVGDPLELTEFLRKKLQENEEKWVYLDTDSAQDGISIQGTYTVNIDIVKVNIKMWKADKELHNFSITGKKNKLPEIINEIINRLALDLSGQVY